MTSLPQRISLVFLLLFNISTLFAEPQNLGLLKNELIHYHDDGEYEKEFNTVVCKAQHYIDKRAAQNNQRGNKQKLAIVLDIDETSLSNYRSMSEHNFSITRTGFAREILKSRGAVFASMLQLFQDAQRHNITVFFVSGRNTSERQATEKNLRSAGYNNWGGLFLKPMDYKEPSIIPFKSGTRQAIEAKGYTIVATIGDQFSDLKGGFAEKGFKLPNPYYYLP